MTTLHIGRSRTEVVTASDGSTPANVTVAAEDPSTVSVSGLTITGVKAGLTNVTYSAPGYQPVSQLVTVSPLPSLIVTDGPEQ